MKMILREEFNHRIHGKWINYIQMFYHVLSFNTRIHS